MIRKTKIVCTLGPATDKGEVLKELMQNGMNVARFNFSHGSHEDHRKRFEMVVTYNGEGKVTKVVITQPTDYTVDNNTENQE